MDNQDPAVLSDKEIAAKLKIIKGLAADLDYARVNFGQVSEALVVHALALLRHERRLRGGTQLVGEYK